MTAGRTAPKSKPRPPRYIKDGVDVYIHIDDLCRELKTVQENPATVAETFLAWKASLLDQGSKGGRPSGRNAK